MRAESGERRASLFLRSVSRSHFQEGSFLYFRAMKELAIEDYTYDLPDEKIAHYPLAERDLSKLLIYKNGAIQQDVYRNISGYLPEDSLIIFNDSRVIEARIVFTKSSGSKIEIFCLEPHESYGGIPKALGEMQHVKWICLIGGASKWKQGQLLEKPFIFQGKEFRLTAKYLEKRMEAFVIELSWNVQDLSFSEVLHYTGQTPLPPYIKRSAVNSDIERYQTIYANESGSVAAPTAGLHFTDHVMQSLNSKNITKDFVTLHVGAGTFKPVKAATMQLHEMHAEYIDVTLNSLERILAFSGKHISAVGTTSVRTIESLYWMGIKILDNPEISETSLAISQWFAYDNQSATSSASESLTALKKWMIKRGLKKIITTTSLLIGPGYRFRVADVLVTNFHQPRSTLLLLVAAMAGPDWRKMYDYAISHNFRFLSYGDGCLIFRYDLSL